MHTQCTITASKPVAPVITHASLLSPATDRLQDTSLRLKPKIPVGHVDSLPVKGLYDTAEQPTGGIDPVIKSGNQAVNPRLIIMCRETGQNFLLNIRFAIAGSIFCIHDIRGRTDQYPLFPDHHPCRKSQTFQKYSGFVIPAILIQVIQILDHSSRFVIPIHTRRIITHLDDPQFAIWSEIHCYWIYNKGFRSDHFHFQIICQIHAGNGFRRSQRPFASCTTHIIDCLEGIR